MTTLAQIEAMSDDEFRAVYLSYDEEGRTLLDYNGENLSEHAAQYASECALYGDAGPGQGLVLHDLRAQHAVCERRARHPRLRQAGRPAA